MARFNAPEDDVLVFKIKRRKLVFVFIGLVMIMVTMLLVGLFIGRGQQVAQTGIKQPPVVVESPSPNEDKGIPIEPLEDTEPHEPAEPPAEPHLAGTTKTTVTPVQRPHHGTKPTPVADIDHPKPKPSHRVVHPKPTRTGVAIQILATKDPVRARKLVRQMKKKGFPAYSEAVDKGLSRVLIGPYASRDEAKKALELLRSSLPADIHPILKAVH